MSVASGMMLEILGGKTLVVGVAVLLGGVAALLIGVVLLLDLGSARTKLGELSDWFLSPRPHRSAPGRSEDPSDPGD